MLFSLLLFILFKPDDAMSAMKHVHISLLITTESEMAAARKAWYLAWRQTFRKSLVLAMENNIDTTLIENMFSILHEQFEDDYELIRHHKLNPVWIAELLAEIKQNYKYANEALDAI